MKNKPILLLLLFIVYPLFADNIFDLNNEADLMVFEGDYFGAIEKYKTVLEINPNFINSVKGLAEAYFFLGEYDEAYKQVQSARVFDKNNTELLGLEARILLAVGKLAEAEKIFETIKQREPNNIDAYFGFAEIALMSGKYSESAAKYHDILSISPSNKKALLSLILLSDYQGRYSDADRYLSEVLRFYSGDYYALYIAARHYYLTGEHQQAEKKLRDSIRINPGYLEASLLYSRLLLKSGNHIRIPEILNPFYRKVSNSLIPYYLGKAYEKLEDYETSMKFYAEAFRINPDDEISRFALENILREQYEYNDPLRARYAEYHFVAGKGLEERNYTNRALNSYRRGLLIDPYSVKGRLQYANIFLKSGYRAKYLSELQTLPEAERNKQYISDLIEIHESLLEGKVSSRWNVEQFLVRKNTYTLNLFYYDSINTMHAGGEETVARVFSDILNHSEKITLSNSDHRVDRYSTAFSTSRNSPGNSDYFLILEVSESERTFSVKGSLYSSHTGSLIKEYVVNSTGNNRIWESLNKLSADLLRDAMVAGEILKIDFDRGLINLGRLDGIKKGDIFNIVKKEKIAPDRVSMGKSYPSSEIIGKFEVTETDEYISEGRIRNIDIFSLVNHGDLVVFEKETEKDGEQNLRKSDEHSILKIIMGIKQ